ncbi:hypothetical protein B9Z65_5797 [Elsinoe australis]|uniref:Erythromycin esterase n=1 Tax=Elsinoe australis TaxID=40998 RepID=A0A2P7YJ32_9PEZI|nr:hypothetical protein B9Z65_5797 [Elsinoe australis]
MSPSLPSVISEHAQPLPSVNDPSFGANFDSLGDVPLVLLGDATHGTSEFYRARCAITQRLITHHGFTSVAIEADWPDAREIDAWVRQTPHKSHASHSRSSTSSSSPSPSPRYPGAYPGAFHHFPTWLWRNTEFKSFITWLRHYNSALPYPQRVGVHGLDLYSLGRSMRKVIEYLDRVDPSAAQLARKRYASLVPWAEDPVGYGREAFVSSARSCERDALEMLVGLLKKRVEYAAAEGDGDAYFDAQMNARVVRDAEEYYRAMFYGDEQSWNLRDAHFYDVLEQVMRRQGNRGKVVVWAHNSHIGDSRWTDMGERRGEVNLGQLCREEFGDKVKIVGCGTHKGTVAAAEEWDEDMQIMKVRESREDSYERAMHDTGIGSFWLDLRKGRDHESLRKALMVKRRERFIGAIYRPHTELRSHYSWCVLPKQMDVYIWFDKTEAVDAFETAQPDEPPGAGETYPFGL